MDALSHHKVLRPVGQSAAVPLADLLANEANRRLDRDDEIRSLAASIAAVGLLHPLIVRPEPEQPGKFRIIAGERRFRALKRLKLETAPCIVVAAQDEKAEVLRLVENNQRRPLTPLEEAATVQGLLEAGLEIEAIARSLGRSRGWVARRSSLTKLNERWLRLVRDPESRYSTWPASHLEVVARFPENVQDLILERFEDSWRYQPPGLNDLEQAVGDFQRLLKSAPWKLDDEALCPEIGACTACPKRSSHHPDLFGGEGDGQTESGDTCLDPACWLQKAQAHLRHRIEEARRKHPNLILLNAGSYADHAALKECFGQEVIDAWDVAVCKKNGQGTIPAVVVAGPGLGKVAWVRVPQNADRTTARRVARAAGQNGNGDKTLEERREAYDKRRRQWVIDAVSAKLEPLAQAESCAAAKDLEGGVNLTCPDLSARTLVVLHSLLDGGGWRRDARQTAAQPHQALAWERLTQLDAKTTPALAELCWELLKLALAVWIARLTPASGERDNAPHYAEAQRLCAMLALDLSALRSAAAEAIPYAKAWRAQVADEWAGAPMNGHPTAIQMDDQDAVERDSPVNALAK